MERNAALALVAMAALGLSACGKEEPPKPVDPGSKVEQAARQMGEAARSGELAQVGEAMKQMGSALTGAVKVEPVDFRKLREVLPEKLAGLPRASLEGSKSSLVGLATSQVEAVYGDGKGGRVSVSIVDSGTLTGVASLAAAWIHVEIDKEGTSGYERTTRLAGRKAYERFDTATRTGKLDVLVAGRFLVQLEATGLDAKAFQGVVAKLDLDGLEALKGSGVPADPPAKPAGK